MTSFTHPEDVKSALRKRHGTVASFERKAGLAPESVRDVLRGKPRHSVAESIARDLGVAVSDITSLAAESEQHDGTGSIPEIGTHDQIMVNGRSTV